jgi:hypothetical protein
MHVKFPAIVPHNSGKQTKFLALSKVKPRQEFMQVRNNQTPFILVYRISIFYVDIGRSL